MNGKSSSESDGRGYLILQRTRRRAASVLLRDNDYMSEPSTFKPSLSSSSSYDAKSRSTAARNPVSLRLYKVLGASYDDNATREALNTLSEFYRAPETSRAAPKGKEAEPEKNIRTDDNIGGVVASRVLGKTTVPGNGTAARARKNLRRDVESKVSQGNHSFLRAFKEVDQVCILLPEW